MTAPTNNKAPVTPITEAPSTTTTTFDCHAAAPTAQPAGKTIATLQARAALAGCELIALADGSGFLLCRWGLTRELHDLDEVAQALAAMGAQV